MSTADGGRSSVVRQRRVSSPGPVQRSLHRREHAQGTPALVLEDAIQELIAIRADLEG
jgi:hypothetical protein